MENKAGEIMSSAKVIEQEASAFFSRKEFQAAYELFRRAASLYNNDGNFKQAALCFASAASCWTMNIGEKPFYNAAVMYEKAAGNAQKAHEFNYAALLYKYAALNYERGGDLEDFSRCFYSAKESRRRGLLKDCFDFTNNKINILLRIKNFLLWCSYTFFYCVWGYGERPARSIISAAAIVVISSLFYAAGEVIYLKRILKPNYIQALYLSCVTFTTVGYGDIVPLGLAKIVAVAESFSGLFVIPLFVVGLTRKYLRV